MQLSLGPECIKLPIPAVEEPHPKFRLAPLTAPIIDPSIVHGLDGQPLDPSDLMDR